jgi:alkylated DNA repair protein alkB homolog 1
MQKFTPVLYRTFSTVSGMELLSTVESTEASALPNLYKAAEKAFKAYKDGRQTDPQLMDRVLDFDSAEAAGATVEEVAKGAPEWLRSARIYSIRGVDGFRFIRCPFDHEHQLRLVRRSLREWIEPPAATNLVIHEKGPHDNLWERHHRAPDGSLLSRLTWATLGYQYQWTQRAYVPEVRCPFPRDLERLSADLAAACGWELRPEAAIVNLYGPSSTMGGHLDDAEPCQSAPIVSISLGLEAIYLLGGSTKAVEPVPILVRSGDVILQGGESRRFVHGVPRVLAGSLAPELHPSRVPSDPELALVSEWLLEHRVNINVRQVWEEVWEGRPGDQGVDTPEEIPGEEPNRKRSKLSSEADEVPGENGAS